MPVLPLQFLRSATRDGSVPIVGTFHAAEATGQRLYRLAGPALRRWTRRLAARTAISETARRVAGPALGGPCTIIPGCTDSARFSAALPPLAERAGASPNATPNPDCRTILFVGRGEPRKGLGELIEAFARLRLAHDDLRLVVVGPPGPLGPALRERVRRAGWSNVHFVGPVSEADLPRYYQAAHVFVSPATGGEAFGLVLTEAMAAGAPVIAGDNPGYRAVLRGGADGVLVPPRDPAALAAAIDALLRDEPRRRRMIAAGRARARDFSVESVGAQFLALYDSLAAQARRERGEAPVSGPGGAIRPEGNCVAPPRIQPSLQPHGRLVKLPFRRRRDSGLRLPGNRPLHQAQPLRPHRPVAPPVEPAIPVPGTPPADQPYRDEPSVEEPRFDEPALDALPNAPPRRIAADAEPQMRNRTLRTRALRFPRKPQRHRPPRLPRRPRQTPGPSRGCSTASSPRCPERSRRRCRRTCPSPWAAASRPPA